MTSDTATDNIEDYAEQAEASKVAAAASETAAASSATASASSASGSSTSAAEALASKNAAAVSETNAASSAATAAAQASNSSTSATASETSKVAAVAAQAAAETAETAAETAQAAAEAAETGVAADAATATAQAAIATTQATNSGTSATASEASRVAAVAAQAAAEIAETNAETAETNAETAQTAAETAETNAASSSTSASTSAATATTQAGIATTKAGEAAASATASASSATASEAAKDAALSALDNFQDQYLGDFASDPTTDNDGDPLQAGMLYFNTTDDVMKVYTGSAWVAAYASLSGALLTTNNLSDLVNAATARTNLGLGTAATTASTDYATAAQGTLADSAVQPNDSPTFGSVTVTGTVDGRDVAADGTKLDGIEAGADVTDTTNVTAAGALMDSEVTNLAQVKAFDSSDYATAAQGSTADAALPKSGGAMTGAITTNSTFDGRDVSTDGAKLDGIEAGATADQTAAEIRTLVESATDSNVFTDADHTKLNGIAAGATNVTNNNQLTNGAGYTTFTANQSLNTTSSVSFGGVNINGGLNAVDNIYLAASIYHEGDTDTYLQFNAADTFRVVTGNSQRLVVSNSGVGISNGGLDMNGNNITEVEDIYLRDKLFHDGDTDTYLGFGTNTITLATGGSSEITVDTTGVRLGDTGNGYFQPVSGNYGSIQIDGGAHNGWEGYSIGGRAVFMHDNSNTMGLYDDVYNHWVVKHTFNGTTELYYNDVSKLDTLSNGVSINGNLYTDGSNAEDYDALSGTSPTCNVDNAGAFSLTMSGNTTFTFSGADSGWSMGFILQLTGNGSTVTWPASVDWAGGTAPDAPASGASNLYVFWTRDGGSNWHGVLSSAAYA
jgi:hypothetical protein